MGIMEDISCHLLLKVLPHKKNKKSFLWSVKICRPVKFSYREKLNYFAAKSFNLQEL